MTNNGILVLQYYIEFAKVDSKLACINQSRDFCHLTEILNKFANIFSDTFSQDDCCYVFGKYLGYMVTYHKALEELSISYKTTNDSKLFISKKIQSFNSSQEIQYAKEAIMYLRQAINILENQEYNMNYRTITLSNSKVDKKKCLDASKHYSIFFETYKQYNNFYKYAKNNLLCENSMMSNITMISEFHQGITHLSRYINSNNILELYRFDSHIIRATFDTQKLIIASMLKCLSEVKHNDYNKWLLRYLNIKNIEVPGRNMSNFHEVYTRYNQVINQMSDAIKESASTHK